MTATVRQLRPDSHRPPRYGPDVDLRDVIRQGRQMTEPVRYSDDTWDLAGCPDLGTRATTLRFGLVRPAWRELAKDFALVLGDPTLATSWTPDEAVAQRHAGTARRANWGNVSAQLRRLVPLLQRMDAAGLTSLDQRDWRQLRDVMLGGIAGPDGTWTWAPMTPEAAVRSAVVLRKVHDLGPVLGSAGPFGTRPWGRDELNTVFGFQPPAYGEARNMSQAHGDMFAMLGACMNLIETCADDVIERLAYWHRDELRPATATSESNSVLVGVWDDAVARWPDGLPLPTRLSQQGSKTVATEVVLRYAGYQYEGASVDHAQMASALDTIATAPATDVDPFLVHHPDQARPTWLADDQHLLPTSVRLGPVGLGRWQNALVVAAYYTVAAITALRGLAIGALRPDCVTEQPDGTFTLRATTLKNADVDTLTYDDSFEVITNAHVAAAVDVVNRIRAATGADVLLHDRLTDWPVLFSSNLLDLARGRPLASPLLANPLRAHDQSGQAVHLVPMLNALARAGAGHDVSDLKILNRTEISQTALDIIGDRAHGDMATAIVRRWQRASTQLMYGGHRPNIIMPVPEDLSEPTQRKRAGSEDTTAVIATAIGSPEALSGRGVAKLAEKLETDQLLQGVVDLRTIVNRRRNGALKTVSVGPLAACATPEGGLCGGVEEANHRLCQLGCRNMVLTPYHRARLEYQRRVFARELGEHSHLVAKLADHEELCSDEMDMTDDELWDVLVAGWDPKWAALLRSLLAADDTEELT